MEQIRVCGLCKNSGFEKLTSDPGVESVCNVAIKGSLVPKDGKMDRLDNNATPPVKAQTACFIAFATPEGKFSGWKFEPK